MLLNCVREDSWESLGLQGDPTSPSWRKSVLNIHQEDWCWSWNSNTLVTWCEELTHLERPWCWERLKLGGEGDNRGSDCWMASPTQFAWVWVNSGSWWWTRGPGMLQSMGSQRIRQDWTTEMNRTELLPSSRSSSVLLHYLPLEWHLQIWYWYIDISPSSNDFSSWLIQTGISHDVLCISVK